VSCAACLPACVLPNNNKQRTNNINNNNKKNLMAAPAQQQHAHTKEAATVVHVSYDKAVVDYNLK
jgi:hypothetical protein